MFRPTLANPAQKRTLRPLYAQHQATTWSGFLDPSWNRSFNILPGTVMARKTKEIFTPYTGAAGQTAFGLSAFFVAPLPPIQIDEVVNIGTNLFTVWVGGPDALFEILAPAFDPAGDWSLPTDGSRKLLGATNQGLLTPDADGQFELIDVVGADKIVVRFAPGITAAGV
jgi:hypothetical protein